MNYQRLNELAAKAMGWTLIGWGKCEPSAPFYQNEDGESTFSTSTWNPSTCADDALTLLEQVAGGQRFELCSVGESMKLSDGSIWYCVINVGIVSYALTASLAMTLCALRAANIPESEITAAME